RGEPREQDPRPAWRGEGRGEGRAARAGDTGFARQAPRCGAPTITPTHQIAASFALWTAFGASAGVRSSRTATPSLSSPAGRGRYSGADRDRAPPSMRNPG